MAARTRECPSCALTFDDENAQECPYCGYEFPPERPSLKWAAVLMALLMAWPLFKLLTWLF